MTGEETDAIAYGKLFAAARGSLHPFAFDDLETMGELSTYVENTPSLLVRVQPLDESAEYRVLAKRMTDFAVKSLPISIFDRAKALGLAMDEMGLVDLYRQKEMSWLAPELAYQLVVPLVLTDLDIEDTFEIDDQSRIEVLSDEDLSAMASDYDISGVPGPVADAARFAIVIDMPPMPNPGQDRRLLIREEVPDTAGVEALCEAMRITTSTPTGWARVFRRPVGWSDHWKDALPPFTLIHTARRYPSAFDDYGWLKPGRKVTREELAQLPAVTAALADAGRPTRLAARRLSTALIRDTPDDQLIDACIGLEAVLGQRGAELSYRIALRAAALLSSRATNPPPPDVVFRMARTVYNRRSELVHGGTSTKYASFQNDDADPIPTNRLAVRLLRDVLHERLLHDASWSVEVLDALVLERLGPAPSELSNPNSPPDR